MLFWKTSFGDKRILVHINHVIIRFRRKGNDVVWIIEHFFKRKNASHILNWSIVLIFSILFAWVANFIWFKPYSVDHFFERVFMQYLWVHPEENTRYRWMESKGLGGRHDLLNVVSVEEIQNNRDFVHRQIEMLQSYKRNNLKKEQQISAEVMKYYFETHIYKEQFPFHNYPFNHIEGCHVQLPFFLINFHLINRLEDAEEYLERLASIPEKIDQTIAFNQHRQDSMGYTPPLLMLEVMQEQIDIFMGKGLESNILYEDFSKKITKLENIPYEPLSEMKYKIRREIEDAVLPAYQRLREHIETLKTNSPDYISVKQFSFDYYNYLLSEHLGTDVERISDDLSPDTLYVLLSQELKEYQEKAKKQFATLLGYECENMEECIKSLQKNPNYYYRNDSHGRIHFLRDLNLMSYNTSKKIKLLTNLSTNIPLEAKRLLDIQEPFYTPFHYFPASLDKQRGGELFVRLENLNELPKFGLPIYSLEFAYLGSHLQHSLVIESKLPSLRKVIQYSYYNDGWKYFAKDWALEKKVYDDKKISLASTLSDIILISHAIMDIGVHHHEWGYDKAEIFMMNQTGMSKSWAKAYVLESIALPAKAPATYFGKLEFEKALFKAKVALDEQFNENHFLKYLISIGAVPLKVFEKCVDDYIQAQYQSKEKKTSFTSLN